MTASLLSPIVGAARVSAGGVRSSAAARPLPAGGMWLLDAAGGVSALAGARFEGSLNDVRLNAPVVSMAVTRTGRGYWIVGTDGGVFSFGDARFHGSTGGIRLNQPIVGITRTPSGGGYWLIASDGGVFSFGDARFHGSTGGMTLNRPIIGMTPTIDGRGYWLVASDGGVFSFGDARFYGTTAAKQPAPSVVGLARTADGGGYWISSQAGDVFAFGNAHRFTKQAQHSATAGVIPTEAGDGYWVAAQDGTVRASGAAGSIRSARPRSRVVTVATRWASSGTAANAPVVATGPTAALTFDDGPDLTYTPQILAALAAAGVPATFFTVGYEGVVHPDLLRAEARAGHSVENHTWHHADLTKLSPAGMVSELSPNSDVIHRATGLRPTCFRPPGRHTNDTVVSTAEKLGLAQMLWNVDPQDWSRPGVDAIVSKVLQHSIGQDVVIIMHDGGGDRSQTVAALPAIIAGLRSRGYRFTRPCA